MIDQPSLAIIIDCWDIGLDPIPSNILSFIESTPSIESVVLASYNCRVERQSSAALWYQNYNKLFRSESASRNIKDLTQVHEVYEKNDTKFKNEKTDPLLLDYVNPKLFQIAMRWRWELDYYLETLNPHIKNIYIFGAAWDECVKIRPLGYDSLSELGKINVLTNTMCIKDMANLAVDLIHNDNWTNVINNTYCLKKTYQP
jgi:hypothetical protein